MKKNIFRIDFESKKNYFWVPTHSGPRPNLLIENNHYFNGCYRYCCCGSINTHLHNIPSNQNKQRKQGEQKKTNQRDRDIGM